MNSNHLPLHSKPSLFRPLLGILIALSFFLIFSYFSTGRSKASDASTTDAAAEKASESKAAQHTNKKGILKKTAAKSSDRLTITPQASTISTSLFMINGGGSGTANGDYTSDNNGLNTFYRYFIEVPAGTSRLVVDLFDADIGIGGDAEADLGRDRARPNDGDDFDTTVTYTLINPAGTQQTTEFTSGNSTTPVNADNAWLTLWDSTDTFRDEFTTAAYNNNNGTANWATNWIETGDDSSASNGEIRITGGELRMEGGGSTLAMERGANLTGFTAATLTFTNRSQSTEANDSMVVEASANGGGSWALLPGGTFSGTFANTARTYDITSYISATTRIRFREASNYDNNEFFYVENFQITATRAIPAGHWELRIDQSTSDGDDINAIGIRAHDGTPGVGGTELNVYMDSMMEIGVNPPASGTQSKSYTLYPYVTSGCSCSKNDFDYDSNSGTVGSMSFTSRSGSYTQNYATGSMSANNVWRRDTFTGFTSDTSATEYGLWTSTISITSYLVSNNPNGNYVTYYMGNSSLGASQVVAQAPTGNPVTNAFRIYLPKDDGTKPAKPYLTQSYSLISGINPPQVGQPTRYQITVSMVNPSAQAINLAGGANVVTAYIPGGGVVRASTTPTVSHGTFTAPGSGATGNIVWTPTTVAAGATATLTYRVDVTPTAAGRIPMTGLATSVNGTRAQFVDETGNTTQARATYFVGPICELAVTSQAPTDVDLVDFTATDYDNGVLVEWKTGFEADNLGFNLYREEAGNRSLVNAQLIAGSAMTTGLHTVLQAGESYLWWDKTLSKDAIYWLEDVDLNGLSKWHGPFSVQTPQANQNSLAASKRPVAKLLHQLNDAEAQSDSSNFVENIASLASSARASVAQNLVQSSLASQAAVKISVKQEGWYRLTQPELVRAGLDANSNSALLQLSVDGREVPIRVSTSKDGRFDESSAIEFYGVGLNTPSTNARTYWLSLGSQAGLRVQPMKSEGSPVSASGFATTVERKDRTIYFSSLRNGEQENFFGAIVTASPVSQELQLTNVDLSAGKPAELEVAVQGVTQVPHRVAVQVNGLSVGDILFSGQQRGVNKFVIQPSLLKEGANTVQLVSLNSSSDVNLVDSIRLTYQHSFLADNDALRLSVNGKESVILDGFTNKAIRVFDVTNENQVTELFGEILESKRGYSITVASNETGQRQWLALADGKIKTGAGVKENLPSSWRTANQGADFIIITVKDFFPALEALKMVRQSEGYKVALVDIEDIYDEYSFGQKNPQAIKDFLSFAKSNWKIKPAYLLLAADASFDPKNYLGRGDYDLLPTKLIDTNYLESSTDDWFADFDGDGISDMAVGRLPIRSVVEAERLVNKILSYGKSVASRSALLVSDANDEFSFEGASSRLRALLPADLEVTEVKRGQVDGATAKQQLLEAINRGQKLVNYAGHGSVTLWRGNLLTSEEAKALSNKERLSMFVLMTCLNSYFQDPVLDSLGESLLKAENGGAVAVWGSSALTEPDPQSVMNQEFYRLLFQTRNIGEAILKAKYSTADSDVRRSWILLGDPTMKLK